MTTRASLRPLCPALIALGLLACSPAGATDPEDRRSGEVGVQLGVVLPDSNLTGIPGQWDAVEPEVGFRGDYFFKDHWGWFGDATWSPFETRTGTDVELYTARTGFEFLHAPHWTGYQTFFALGAGWSIFELDQASDFDRVVASISLGQRFARGVRGHVRWELRGDHTVTDSGLGGADLTTGHFLVTWSWGGLVRRPDSDGDGVHDGRDRCPGTPKGAIVDARGCPSDQDGDGVVDGVDRCPNTPQGWKVDADGCPLDSDGDGVPDGKDDCPDTPRGAAVDSRGCALDSDGDGVADGLDRCPDTPRGARVDGAGCPADSDGDGVFDGIDRCPGTPKSAVVDDAGCPLDGDGDGVFDGIDRCPDTPPNTAVDEVGCARSKPLFEEDKRTLVLEGVYFEFNSATVTPGSRAVLDRVADSLLDWPEIRVEIGGHTDSRGAAAYNLKLSTRRADSVRNHLVQAGVDSNRLVVRGYGEEKPVADNATDEGRAFNRRVELTKLD